MEEGARIGFKISNISNLGKFPLGNELVFFSFFLVSLQLQACCFTPVTTYIFVQMLVLGFVNKVATISIDTFGFFAQSHIEIAWMETPMHLAKTSIHKVAPYTNLTREGWLELCLPSHSMCFWQRPQCSLGLGSCRELDPNIVTL